MNKSITTPDSLQPATDLAVDVFDNWFDLIEAEVRARSRGGTRSRAREWSRASPATRARLGRGSFISIVPGELDAAQAQRGEGYGNIDIIRIGGECLLQYGPRGGKALARCLHDRRRRLLDRHPAAVDGIAGINRASAIDQRIDAARQQMADAGGKARLLELEVGIPDGRSFNKGGSACSHAADERCEKAIENDGLGVGRGDGGSGC